MTNPNYTEDVTNNPDIPSNTEFDHKNIEHGIHEALRYLYSLFALMPPIEEGEDIVVPLEDFQEMVSRLQSSLFSLRGNTRILEKMYRDLLEKSDIDYNPDSLIKSYIEDIDQQRKEFNDHFTAGMDQIGFGRARHKCPPRRNTCTINDAMDKIFGLVQFRSEFGKLSKRKPVVQKALEHRDNFIEFYKFYDRHRLSFMDMEIR